MDPQRDWVRIGREQGYLPAHFQQVSGHGTEIHILAAQAALITLIALLYAFIPTVSSAYWMFTAPATQVYLIMYLLMFVDAVRLRRAQPDHPRGCRAPALSLLCMVGGVASVVTFLVGSLSPSQLAHTGPLVYAVLIAAGILILGIRPPLLLRFRKPTWKAATVASGARP